MGPTMAPTLVFGGVFVEFDEDDGDPDADGPPLAELLLVAEDGLIYTFI